MRLGDKLTCLSFARSIYTLSNLPAKNYAAPPVDSIPTLDALLKFLELSILIPRCISGTTFSNYSATSALRFHVIERGKP